MQIECITTADRCLYVGTADGYIHAYTLYNDMDCHCCHRLIVYYLLEENLSPLGKTIYQNKVKGQIQLGGDKVYYMYVGS